MTELPDLQHADFRVGQAARATWRVDESEIDRFAALSGDLNPLHLDAGFAAAKGFAGRVAHGMLLAARLSAFAGMQLPGRNCLLLEFNLAWPAPMLAGDEITIEGKIVEASESLGTLKVAFRARKSEDGKACTIGRGWYLCKVLS